MNLKRHLDDFEARSIRAARVIRVMRLAVYGIYRSGISRMAAALSFRTIFGLVPVLVIGLALLGAFAKPEDVAQAVRKGLEYSGISNIALEEQSVTEVVHPTTQFAPTGMGFVPIMLSREMVHDVDAEQVHEQDVEEAQARVDEWITALVDRVRGIKFGTVGVLGLLVLAYAAISLLVEVEKAFNQICHAESGRSWRRRIPMYWTLLTIGTAMLFSSFYIGEQFTGTLVSLAEHAGFTAGRLTLGVLGYIVTTAISTLLLLLVYTTIPNRRVGLRPALTGALVAAVLWEAGKWGFTQYLSYSTNYARLYGSLALIPLFMLWIYVTWLIVLLGLQTAWGVQNLSRFGVIRADGDDDSLMIDADDGLAVMESLSRAFARGESRTLSAIAREAQIDPRAVEALVERLARAGFVHEVAQPEDQAGEPRYAPSKPAEGLRVREVITAMSMAQDRPGSASGAIRQAMLDALGDHPLSTWIEGATPAQPEASPASSPRPRAQPRGA
ncbi:MAG: YihY/virulence factor BrkB family protein [Phycisphaerales bacterium]|jgi:membrane protein|nr:YihY/virulence factor BrkB family protein [Phycisphaerales bacterium]